MEKRAVCLMAIGERYQAQLERMETGVEGRSGQFTRYADACGAELVVLRDAPDPSMHRSILYQKLLVPSICARFDLVLFIDLDVVISSRCPDVFRLMPENAGLAAVLAPRGAEKYRRAWQHIPRVEAETATTYFTSRNFPPSEKHIGDINGGVLLFRPERIARQFEDYYWSDHSQGVLEGYEEAPMAHITQTTDLFHPLDERFNTQFLYELQTPAAGYVRAIRQNGLYRKIDKTLSRKFGLEKDFLLRKAFRSFRDHLLDTVYILHFSGMFSPQLYTDCRHHLASGAALLE